MESVGVTETLALALVGLVGWVVRSGLTGLRVAVDKNTHVLGRLLTTLTVHENAVLTRLDQHRFDHQRHEKVAEDTLEKVREQQCSFTPAQADHVVSRASKKDT